jgi:hypothetical protein
LRSGGGSNVEMIRLANFSKMKILSEIYIVVVTSVNTVRVTVLGVMVVLGITVVLRMTV